MEKPQMTPETAQRRAEGKKAFWLFFLCWLAYAMNYICRKNYSVCMAAMMADGLFDKAFAGTILTGFFMAYALGQLICGFLGDKISPKVMVSGGLIGAGLMNFLMPLSHSPLLCLGLWCANGLFCAMLWAPIIRLFAECLTKEEQLRYGSMMTVAIPAGQMVAYALASLVLDSLGWKGVFFISGLTNVVMGLGFFLGLVTIRRFMEERREKLLGESVKKTNRLSHEVKKEQEGLSEHPKVPKRILLSTGFLFAAVGILFNGILKDGVTDWTPTYLSDHFTLSSSLVSLLMTVLPIFNLVGVLASSRLFKKTRNEYTASVPLFAISLLAMLVLFTLGRLSPVVSIICAALCTSTMLGVNNLLLTFVPLNYSVVGKAAFSTGFLDAFSYLATAISGIAIGSLTASAGWTMVLVGWILVAALGLANCLLAIRPWNKGRSQLRLYGHHLSDKGQEEEGETID